MTTKKQIRVGMVGYRLMGRAHSHAYRDFPFYFDSDVIPDLRAIAGRDEEGIRAAANKMGWASWETDWRCLIKRDDIDLIDIVTPNNTHAEIAIAATEAGKHVFCEKALALTLDEAKRMLEAANKAGVTHMICHNYRFSPAVQFAKKLIVGGRLGKIYHIRAHFPARLVDGSGFPPYLASEERGVGWRDSRRSGGPHHRYGTIFGGRIQ